MDMSRMLPPMIPELLPNPQLVEKIVKQLKINGVFDQMRKECLADIDTKPAFQNLKQRVEGHVSAILAKQEWKPSLNKNQLRSHIRESVLQSGLLNEGVERLLHQVFDAKVMTTFLPKISDFIAEKGDELKKEFLPVIEDMPPPEMPIMMDQPSFVSPPVPTPTEMQPEPVQLPPMPTPPPLPESPVIPIPKASLDGNHVKTPVTPPKSPIDPPNEEVVQIDYYREVSPENIIVKAIKTPSPEHPVQDSPDTAPVIPEDAVNPLRNLIQSLLTSKSMISTQDSPGNPDGHGITENERSKRKSRKEGYSPTIDPSQIEAFTDEEDSPASQGVQDSPCSEYVPKTPTEEVGLEGNPMTPLHDAMPPGSKSATPPSPYSPISNPHRLNEPGTDSDLEEVTYEPYEEISHIQHDVPSASRDNEEDDNNATYDPMRFSYEQMSSPPMYTEEASPNSPPSPISVDSNPEQHQQSDDNRLFSEESRNDTDLRQGKMLQKSPNISRSVSSSEDSSSDSDSTSSSAEENETLVAEVEETVEEIEVMEEYTSESAKERSQDERSEDSSDSIEEKRKKPKKRKEKKARKRKRSKSSRSSISSGEITSSGELTSDSSSDRSRPTRPNVAQRRKTPLELQEMEERRRELQQRDEKRDRPFWANTESSSEYLSSPPGRIRHPFSPPRGPYSPEYHRFENERIMDQGYGPPPGPHFRDRHMFHPGEFRPPMHRPRFSPPPFRRSPPPPHRYSPGPRMDFPHPPPFGGSQRSPPRRNYSPPPPHHMPPRHMMGGFPGDMRPHFPPPVRMHRYGSPPHPGMNPHRRPSRSPPPHPGMRMEDMPGTSKHMRF